MRVTNEYNDRMKTYTNEIYLWINNISDDQPKKDENEKSGQSGV